jgi:hypothetical protein
LPIESRSLDLKEFRDFRAFVIKTANQFSSSIKRFFAFVVDRLLAV